MREKYAWGLVLALVMGQALASNQNRPSVAYNSSESQYLVVWFDDRGIATSGLDIYGQLLDADGNRIGEDFAISTADRNQINPKVVYNSQANEYLVVWDDERNIDSSGWDIYGQRVASDGNLISSNFPISTAPRTQRKPELTYNSRANEYLVV